MMSEIDPHLSPNEVAMPANAARRTPVARGLTSWAASPPRFDALSADASELASSSATSIVDLAGLIDELKRSDLRANRQNCPDLAAQLDLAIRRPIDTVICSILDIDPAACVQSASAAAQAAELVAGVSLLQRLSGAANAWIVIDARVPGGWWSQLRVAARSARGIKIVELSHAYPQADPTLLLYTMTDRRLQPRRLPPELGAIILDGVAAIMLGSISLRGRAPALQPLVVRDHDHHESYFVAAPSASSIDDLLQRLHLKTAAPAAHLCVRAGDLLRDRQVELSTRLSETELVLHLSARAEPVNPESCIRCGWCFEACPTRCRPAMLLEAAQTSDDQLARRAGLHACIECGICSYVCPSHLPLLSSIRRLLNPDAS